MLPFLKDSMNQITPKMREIVKLRIKGNDRIKIPATFLLENFILSSQWLGLKTIYKKVEITFLKCIFRRKKELQEEYTRRQAQLQVEEEKLFARKQDFDAIVRQEVEQ